MNGPTLASAGPLVNVFGPPESSKTEAVDVPSTVTSLHDMFPQPAGDFDYHERWSVVAPAWIPSDSRNAFIHYNNRTIRVSVSSSGNLTQCLKYVRAQGDHEDEEAEVSGGNPWVSLPTIRGHHLSTDTSGYLCIYRADGWMRTVQANPITPLRTGIHGPSNFTFACPISGVIGCAGRDNHVLHIWGQE